MRNAPIKIQKDRCPKLLKPHLPKQREYLKPSFKSKIKPYQKELKTAAIAAAADEKIHSFD